MKGTRIYELLRAIQVNDLKLLDEFINSPVFNRSKRVSNAYEVIKLEIENNKTDEIDRRFIVSAAFGKEKFNNANFRMFLSDFTRVLERFLLFKEKSPYDELELLTLFRKVEMYKSFDKLKGELSAKYTGRKVKDTFDYYALYSIESELIFRESNIENLTLADTYIDLIYLSMKLDTAIRLATQGKEWNDFAGMIKEGYLKLEINKLKHPMIYAKLLTLRLVSGEADSSKELIELEKKYKDDMSFTTFIYDVLLWYYRKTGNHKSEFELISKQDNEIINGSISPNHFLLMIDAGLAAGELLKTTNLFNRHSCVVKDINAVSLAKAKIELYKHNYESALAELSRIRSADAYYYEQVSQIKLHIFQATGDKQSYKYTLDAARHKTKRMIKHL